MPKVWISATMETYLKWEGDVPENEWRMMDSKQLVTYLKAYHADLEYQFKQDGFEYMNSVSCGTPCFENDLEAQKYLADLSDFITMKEEAA